MSFVHPDPLVHHQLPPLDPNSATGWPAPDPTLSDHHEALFHNALINQGITSTDLFAGDVAVAECLHAATQAFTSLERISAFVSTLPSPSHPPTLDPSGDSQPKETEAEAGAGAPPPPSSHSHGMQHQHIKRKRGPASASALAPQITTSAGTATTRPITTPIQPPPPSTTTAAHRDEGTTATTTTTTTATTPQHPITNKGLKHFSLKVCEKVEEKGCTNYNEVADELVKDLAADAAAGLSDGNHDEKNVRRRVYDALNVLEALGIIAKSKRDIEWIGWPAALQRNHCEKERLEAERGRIVARVCSKLASTQDITAKAFCLSNLVLRNRDAPMCALHAAQDAGLPAPNPLPLPFMLVHAPETAQVDIHIAPDEKNARLDFHHWPFQIFDDEQIMTMMGLGEPQPELAVGVVDLVLQNSAPPHPPPQEQEEEEEGGLGGVASMDASTPLKPPKPDDLSSFPRGMLPTAFLSPSAAVSAIDLGPPDSVVLPINNSPLITHTTAEKKKKHPFQPLL